MCTEICLGFNNLDKNVGLGTDLMSWFVIGALMHFTNNNYFNHKSKLPNLKVHVKRFEANLFGIFYGQCITYISCWYQIKYIMNKIYQWMNTCIQFTLNADLYFHLFQSIAALNINEYGHCHLSIIQYSFSRSFLYIVYTTLILGCFHDVYLIRS